MGQSLDIPRVIPNDWKRLDLIVSKIKFKLGRDSSPTFADLTLSGLTASRLVATDSGKVLKSSDLASWVTQTTNQVLVADDGDGTITLSTPQDIHAGASPTFANLSLGIGELTAGSINRASGTLTLEIGGTAELSITSTATTFGGVLLAPDGAVGAPSYSFIMDTTSGMYWDDDDVVLNFAIEGFRAFYVESTSIAIKDGSSSNFGRIRFFGVAMTANRLLTLDLNNAARTIDLTGNPTLADWFDQSVKTTADIQANVFKLPTTTSTVGIIKQNGVRVFHTFVPTDQAPTWKNVFIGENAGSFLLNNSAQPYFGTGNVALGTNALDALTTGYYNFAIGTSAGSAITSGDSNVMIGHQAGLKITSGDDSVYIGRDSGVKATVGHNNVGIGQNTCRELVGASGNVCIGGHAGRHNLQSNRFIVDSINRGNAATEITNAILYGILAATPAAQSLRINANVFLPQIKSGATQGGAGAAANEIWKTASHATLPDNVLMIGI